MKSVTIFEFDIVIPMSPRASGVERLSQIPEAEFNWLEDQCLRMAENGTGVWARLIHRHGHKGIQVRNFVGVIRSPNGFQIEVLPKTGKRALSGDAEARQLLINMLRCLNGFRHIQTESAMLAAARMPLLEVFISEFLLSVERVVKRGLRSSYTFERDNLFALRGKLLVSQNIRQNLTRADRFYTEHDEFTADRPENRLLKSALYAVGMQSSSYENLKLARELEFVFADIPFSELPDLDFQRVQIDRGMGHYDSALAWARLILDENSPLTGSGDHHAPSLLFPMEAVFEAYVAKHLARQLQPPAILKTQAASFHLTKHLGQRWFKLKPDLLVKKGAGGETLVVLDTKWKLLDKDKANAKDKYGLSQSDFYQLHAYGHSYLNGKGDVVLVYPKTDTFPGPLEVFDFLENSALRLWVLPFCLETRELLIPEGAPFASQFVPRVRRNNASG